MSRIQFGATYSTAMSIGPVEFAQRAEEWGYDSYWAPEFLTLPTLDPLVLLAAVAQVTDKIRLGTAVVALAFRSPFQLAKAALSVDLLSKGRLDLGVGIGGVVPKDLEIEQVDLKERGRITNERLDILRRLLGETHVSHQGRFHQFDDLTIGPRPVQKPNIPLWVGARWTGRIADGALRRAARYGDAFIFPADTPTGVYPETQQRIRHHAASCGRDPEAIRWAGTMWVCLGNSKSEARETANTEIQKLMGIPWDVQPDRCYGLGTPQDCIESIQRFVDLGVSHLMFAPSCPSEQILHQYEVLAREVIPYFKEER